MKPTPPVAQYEQLARDLRQRILDGEWAPGVTLPGAPTLAAVSGVTQSIGQRALELLVSWRLVSTGAGRGTVVLPLAGYQTEMTLGRADGTAGQPADAATLRDALAAASDGDPMLDGLEVSAAGVAGWMVSAVVTAAHPGHAADQLAELVRAAALKGWDLAAASVSARPE